MSCRRETTRSVANANTAAAGDSAISTKTTTTKTVAKERGETTRITAALGVISAATHRSTDSVLISEPTTATTLSAGAAAAAPATAATPRISAQTTATTLCPTIASAVHSAPSIRIGAVVAGKVVALSATTKRTAAAPSRPALEEERTPSLALPARPRITTFALPPRPPPIPARTLQPAAISVATSLW